VTADLKISILVVDDSATMLRITHDVLGKLGYRNVDEANGGRTALEKLRTKRYDLVICDWNMEPMTGYHLLRRMHNDPYLGQIPLIMMTGSTRVENVIAAKKAGVSTFIFKPASAPTIKAKIDAVFGGRPFIEVSS
jgi:two-component system chemotaxis response regulator CheY